MDLNLTRSAYTGKRGEGGPGARGLALFINFFRNLFFFQKTQYVPSSVCKKTYGRIEVWNGIKFSHHL